MGKSKREISLSLVGDLVKHFRTFSDDQLLKMKYTPRGNTDKIFKKAINEEIKRRRDLGI